MDHHVKQAPVQGVTGLWGGNQGALMAGGAEDPVYVDDVFSTYLYKGTNGANTVNTGLDMSGEGGLLWVKSRSNRSHQWFDTVRGVNKHIHCDTTAGEGTDSNMNQTFTSTGFTFNNTYTDLNDINGNYASWSFRKAPGFFDIVTYTGSGSTQTLSHSLGSTPGMIIVKRLDTSTDWGVYHRGQVGYDGGTDAEDYRLRLNTTTYSNNDTYWGDTAPTTTQFTVGDSHTEVNASGGNYIAYIFAHDEQSFGESADSSVIKCGNYTGNGSTNGPEVNVGWEPQWIMVKRTDGGTGLWLMADNMRGVVNAGNDPYLQANGNNAEYTTYDWIEFTPTGFKLTQTGVSLNSNGDNYVYTAIRRSDGYVGKPATAGTDVLAMDSGNSSSTIPTFDSGFPVDFAYYRTFTGSSTWFASARLTQKKYLQMCYQDDFETDNEFMFDSNVGWSKNADDSNFKSWMWKRHAGFDIVMYDGDGTGNRAITHQMATAPEMIWFKGTSFNDDWLVYNYYWVDSDQGAIRMNYGAPLNENASSNSISPQFGTANPTATTFNVGWSSGKDKTNKNGEKYIAFLFAPVTGISALGSYTGTGQGDSSGPQITGLGFTPRFVLVRSGSAGSWCQFDNTLTGLYLVRYNTIGTWLSGDYIEFVSGGFNIIKGPGGQIADVNNNNQKYIYYAHA